MLDLRRNRPAASRSVSTLTVQVSHVLHTFRIETCSSCKNPSCLLMSMSLPLLSRDNDARTSRRCTSPLQRSVSMLGLKFLRLVAPKHAVKTWMRLIDAMLCLPSCLLSKFAVHSRFKLIFACCTKAFVSWPTHDNGLSVIVSLQVKDNEKGQACTSKRRLRTMTYLLGPASPSSASPADTSTKLQYKGLKRLQLKMW